MDSILKRDVKIPFFTTEWGRDEVVMFPFKSDGSFIGHLKGTKKFLYAPMNSDGTPDTSNIGTIDNVDDDVVFVNLLNAFFGTDVTIRDFPGR